MFPSFLLWAQVTRTVTPANSSALQSALQWLLVWGEPSLTDIGIIGYVITWLKVLGLVTLLSWIVSRLVASRGGPSKGIRPLDYAALGGLALALVCVFLQVVESGRKRSFGNIGPVSTIQLLTILSFVVIAVWVEVRLWTGLARQGSRSDLGLLGTIHAAMALGIGSAYALSKADPRFAWVSLGIGIRMGATFMGLVALAWTVVGMLGELVAIRPRRLYAIAWQCWVESFRRMWAPWVVLIVFGVILAFFDWFVTSSVAEMGRSYIGSLMFLAAILMMLMVTILSPISLPNDIRQQTIYTIVSKPVRRLELVWGRMIGYMALVTVLLVAFGGISLAYLYRNVEGAYIKATADAAKARKQNRPDFARQYDEQAEQLRTRMTARLPVKGSLVFIDSKNKQVTKGIDVGQEMELRSHIEGATPSKAIWRFGMVRDPLDPAHIIDRKVPVGSLLQDGTIEKLQDEVFTLATEAAAAESGAKASESGARTARLKEQIEARRKELKLLVDREAKYLADARALGNSSKAGDLRNSALALHSPDIPIEMTFTVYRTTKGELGEPVLASMAVANPRVPNQVDNQVFSIHEYYTNKRYLPARLLVGSGGDLQVSVQCMSPNQYLGMAESDLFLVASSGDYRANFLKGLLGVWLQAMVLTAIGVFAGTFLSWPVALVTTIFFLLAGYAAVGTLFEFSQHLSHGGGPFESLIRMIGHENMETELAATPAVIIAKSLDSVLTPVLERLVYVIPNLTALDVSTTVADGFAVTGEKAFLNVLLGLGYALPFSIAGYFILKNREVAA